MPYVVPKQISVQYDGTNGVYICGDWSDNALTLVSDDGQTLHVQWTVDPDIETTVQVGDWIIFQTSGLLHRASAAAYAQNWLELP